MCFPRVLLNYQGTCGTDPPWMLIKHVSTPWKDGNLVSVIAPHVKHGVPETKAMGLFLKMQVIKVERNPYQNHTKSTHFFSDCRFLKGANYEVQSYSLHFRIGI